jgi:hypothetical protein
LRYDAGLLLYLVVARGSHRDRSTAAGPLRCLSFFSPEFLVHLQLVPALDQPRARKPTGSGLYCTANAGRQICCGGRDGSLHTHVFQVFWMASTESSMIRSSLFFSAIIRITVCCCGVICSASWTFEITSEVPVMPRMMRIDETPRPHSVCTPRCRTMHGVKWSVYRTFIGPSVHQPGVEQSRARTVSVQWIVWAIAAAPAPRRCRSQPW